MHTIWTPDLSEPAVEVCFIEHLNIHRGFHLATPAVCVPDPTDTAKSLECLEKKEAEIFWCEDGNLLVHGIYDLSIDVNISNTWWDMKFIWYLIIHIYSLHM